MWGSGCWPWIRHQHTQGCSLNSKLFPAACILTVSCRALGVAQVLFWKQRVKHFQSLFYKNKPVLPWYSVASGTPTLLPFLSLELQLLRTAASCSHGSCQCHTLLRVSPSKHRGRGLVPFCKCLLFSGSKLETAPRCLLVALPFLHREQVLGKSLRVHTLRRGVGPSLSLGWKSEPHEVASCLLVEPAGCHSAGWLSVGSVGS